MPNRLAAETSPYLLQHRDNPVDWYPWADEALECARREQLPIFLSVGYSACHWCHVMERESFRDPQIAAALNEQFVCIKVDREERPDIDQIYMNAVQLMTGRGGWPMSVFLTPELEPFYGGTYWPPADRQGMPGFARVIAAVAEAWRERREVAREQSQRLTQQLRNIGAVNADERDVDEADLDAATAKLEQAFDFTHGGFGAAPKFPHAMDLQFCLRRWWRTGRERLLDMVQLNLDKMAAGGIYDQLGGGFARYSVDERWLVPHFEKMLYDNGLLAGLYLDAYRATGKPSYARVARGTLDYLLTDMRDPAGGFHSAEDADSEGVEGKFYVWSAAEIRDVLGADVGDRFCEAYGVTEAGNFEGQNVLYMPRELDGTATDRDRGELSDDLEAARRALLAHRGRRPRPGRDDKVLVSWNALVIDSLARAAAVLDDSRYLTAASDATAFILGEMVDSDGRLLHSWRQGTARFAAYLDDYTYLIQALVTLYEATFDERWIERAVQFAEIVVTRFYDRDNGGFFFVADDHESLLVRNKDIYDSSVPSGNAMAAVALHRLGALTGETRFRDAARGALQLGAKLIRDNPLAAGQMLVAAEWLESETVEVVWASARDDRRLDQLRAEFLPHRVLAGAVGDRLRPSSHLDALLAGKHSAMSADPQVFVCRGFSCQAPQSPADALESLRQRPSSA